MCKAGAAEKGVPLYRHIADLAGNPEVILPVPVSIYKICIHFYLVSSGPPLLGALAFAPIGNLELPINLILIFELWEETCVLRGKPQNKQYAN